MYLPNGCSFTQADEMSSSAASFATDMAVIFAFAQASLPAVPIAVAVLVASLLLLEYRNGAAQKKVCLTGCFSQFRRLQKHEQSEQQ
jgi:hypothetical protein